MTILIMENQRVKYRLRSISSVTKSLRLLGFSASSIENALASVDVDSNEEYFIRL